MKKIIFLGCIIAVLCGMMFITTKTAEKIKIRSVTDGDTVSATVKGEDVSIRLKGIDCYETQNRQRAYKQAYENNLTLEQVIEKGKKSTEILTTLLNEHKENIYFEKSSNLDRYNRQIGTIYAGKINVNEYMMQKGGCLKYNYTTTLPNKSEKQPWMSFVIWYSIFAVLAWYQQQHWNKYKGESKRFYVLLSAYCLLNFAFLCSVIYLGFRLMSGWFVVILVLSPFVTNYLMLKVEMLFYKLHYFKHFSMIGLLLIPLSIYQIIGSLWYTVYLLTLLAYCSPQLISKIKRWED